MIEYPKIETLYDRGEDFDVDVSRVRKAEFMQIRSWLITEKVDGTNMRVGLHADGSVEFNGRTDRAQIPSNLAKYMVTTFAAERMQGAFEKNEDGTWPEVTLFGEGYGPGIQNGGAYRSDVSFRLFDVLVGKWWLEWDNVCAVADKLNILTVPELGYMADEFPHSESDLYATCEFSMVAREEGDGSKEAEGIVARADPMLYDKFGNRMMWKLKFRDFRKGKR